jgi:ubiquinone/menaquinone biosynthesis C-methylase UbiE
MNKEKHHHRGKSSESLLDKQTILRELNILTGQTVLDAGCGNGYMAKEFAKITEESGKVYALDPDEISINILKSEVQNTVIEAFVGDITKETELKDSSIDIIYLSTVIHGFSEKQMDGFLKEIKRILKPSGKLGILEINKNDTPFGPPMGLRFSPEELIKEINLNPTKTVKVGQYFYLQIFKK